MSTISNEELVALICNGDDVKLNTERLWTQNTGLIASICGKYANNAEMDDLLQESFLSLTLAVQSYDSEVGAFSTYFSHMIEWQLIRYLQSTGKNIRIPAAMYKPMKRYKQAVSAYQERTGLFPSDQELCQALGCSLDALRTIRAALAAYKTERSLNEPLGEDSDDAVLADTVPAPGDLAEDATDRIFLEQRAAAVWEAVDSLPEMQATAIRWRYQTDLTYREIAQRMDTKESAVRTAHDSGIRAIRHGKSMKQLKRFWEETNPFRRIGAQTFFRTQTSSTESLALRELELQQRLEEKMRQGAYC